MLAHSRVLSVLGNSLLSVLAGQITEQAPVSPHGRGKCVLVIVLVVLLKTHSEDAEDATHRWA